MIIAPPQEVVEAIESGTTHVLRRAEIYESDGETIWEPSLNEESDSRLIDGSISIDYGRAERRTLDLTLDNQDKLLRSNPNGGFWYDKVIKIFRGVRYSTSTLPPRIAIIEADGDGSSAYELRAILQGLGFSRTDVVLSATVPSDVSAYDLIVSYMRTEASVKHVLLKSVYSVGKNVITIGAKNSETEIPLIAASSVIANQTYSIEQTATDNPLKASWNDTTIGTVTNGRRINTVASGVTVVAKRSEASVPYPMAMITFNSQGGRWFHYQPASVNNTNSKLLLKNALNWLRNYEPYKNWETQVGEFVIDNIAEDHFPHFLKVTGRDYTKKCLTSKIESTVSFEAGTPIVSMITSLAANAGITKFNIPNHSEVLSSRIDIERGTERWNIMKQAAESQRFELYFNSRGVLTMRQFVDPSFGAISETFKTGVDGNLTSYTRSTNDSRIYNHVVVFGDPPEGEERLPYFGEAKNVEPSSPTRIAKLGDRYYSFASTFFTSDAQCQEYANEKLKQVALESYELNFSSLTYPWVEAGEIVEILDPDRIPGDPTRYLMDTISLPLGLGPMSATGKRVTYVGSDVSPEEPLEEVA